MSRLIIIGAGGFGLEVAGYAMDIRRADPDFPAVAGFLDDTKTPGVLHAGYPVLGGTDAALDDDAAYCIAIGSPTARRALDAKWTAKGARFISLVHPLAYVGQGAVVGPGAIVAPFASIAAMAHLGRQCVLNFYAMAGHEAVLGDYCVLSPQAGVHGASRLGQDVFMGAASYVTAQTKVGDGAKIAAGAVVYSDVPDQALAMGNPASYRKEG